MHLTRQDKEMMPTDFDFGAGMRLPPRRKVVVKQEPPPFRSLAQNADGPLLDYLHRGKVSPYFLVEIDKFLSGHPEISHYTPGFENEINHTSPLNAYCFFVQGYTKPARYIDGVSISSMQLRTRQLLRH